MTVSQGVGNHQTSNRRTALQGNLGVGSLGQTNRMSWPPGNVDGARDETRVSRGDQVYAKPLRKILG
jgi:hypothetical protein